MGRQAVTQRLPPDVQRLVQLRAALGAVEPTHGEYVARVRGQALDRQTRFAREHPWQGHRVLRIRHQRERLRMSVGDLAEATGLYEVEVEMIEAGEADVSAEQLIKIATALFTTVEMLEGREPWRV